MKLVVGLGNPGKEYQLTRHNVGFMIIDNYANIEKLSFKSKDKGLYCEKIINNEKVLFLKPQSYMNLSGIVVAKYAKFFKIVPNDIFVIYDDMDFELGSFKIKPSGSSAGHNGINSIIQSLQTENIKRMRVGISKNNSDKADYVLGRLSVAEQKQLQSVIDKSKDIIDSFVSENFEKVMSIYN